MGHYRVCNTAYGVTWPFFSQTFLSILRSSSSFHNSLKLQLFSPHFVICIETCECQLFLFADITPRPVTVHISRFIADLFITNRFAWLKKGRIQTEKMKRVKCHQILTNWTKMFSQIKLRKNAGHGNRWHLFSEPA